MSQQITKIIIDLNQVDADGNSYTRMSNAEKPVRVGEKVLAYEAEEGTAFYGEVIKVRDLTAMNNRYVYMNLDRENVFNLYEDGTHHVALNR